MTRPVPEGPARWVGQAACRGADPALFLTPATPEQTRDALATCDGCPVRHQCLKLGLAQPAGADTGIWGGTTEEDRQQLRAGLDNTRQHAPERPAPPPPARHGPPAPKAPLRRDDHGVHHDTTGRIEVAELLRAPRRMVLLDGRPVARTKTLADAGRAAWQALRDHPTPTRTSARSRT